MHKWALKLPLITETGKQTGNSMLPQEAPQNVRERFSGIYVKWVPQGAIDSKSSGIDLAMVRFMGGGQ